jgi:hypothetical protein
MGEGRGPQGGGSEGNAPVNPPRSSPHVLSMPVNACQMPLPARFVPEPSHHVSSLITGNPLDSHIAGDLLLARLTPCTPSQSHRLAIKQWSAFSVAESVLFMVVHSTVMGTTDDRRYPAAHGKASY